MSYNWMEMAKLPPKAVEPKREYEKLEPFVKDEKALDDIFGPLVKFLPTFSRLEWKMGMAPVGSDADKAIGAGKVPLPSECDWHGKLTFKNRYGVNITLHPTNDYEFELMDSRIANRMRMEPVIGEHIPKTANGWTWTIKGLTAERVDALMKIVQALPDIDKPVKRKAGTSGALNTRQNGV